VTTTNSAHERTDAATRIDELWSSCGPLVMGIVNCTPDSFSDGNRFLDHGDAVAEAERHLEAGAKIVDIGGESTRPGADTVAADEECRRVLPVIDELRRRRPAAVISIDTTKVAVAAAALAAGADVVNDVSAAAEDGMLEVVAEHRAGIVLMHRRGTPGTMQQDTRYDDVVAEVHDFLRGRASAAVDAGIPACRVWLDPGIGFGKDDAGNLTLLAALPELAACGHPVVVGPSRKSFIGRLTGAPVEDRLGGTLGALVPSIGLERLIVRVHEPAPTIQFLEIASRLSRRAGTAA
jgi:dihydropteroate synthase